MYDENSGYSRRTAPERIRTADGSEKMPTFSSKHSRTMKTKLKYIAICYLLSAICVNALAQGTAFTYQGRLNDGANPAGGIYDLRFAIYDSLNAGTQQGSLLTNSATAVSNGLFTATLDFGNQFPGAGRWLEIGVRTNGGGSFFTLSPRQALTPAPYAITAGSVVSGGLGAGTYGNALTFNNANNSFTGAFSGNGANVTNVNAAKLGGVPVAGFWQTGGNLGTFPGANILGSLDNQPLELWVNGARALKIIPTTNTVNLIGGFGGNVFDPGVTGATIAGGGGTFLGQSRINYVRANFGTIGGGAGNTASNAFSTVAGGLGNIASGPGAFVGGGGYEGTTAILGNTASGPAATVSGGSINKASGSDATVGGGYNNFAFGYGATVGGGLGNTATNTAATVAGGAGNVALGNGATVAGGNYNTATNSSATVGGGNANTAIGNFSTVAGGFHNTASGEGSFVGGGGYIYDTSYPNTASGDGATVSGGAQNEANGDGATVGGGVENTAYSDSATIGGGSQNDASGEGSTVGGGEANSAWGYASTVPGGFENFAGADYSFAAGCLAEAETQGSFVWADSTTASSFPFVYFDSTAPNQFLIRAAGGVGIGTAAPETPLHIADFHGITLGTSATGGGYTALRIDLSAAQSGYAELQAISQAGSSYGNLILQANGGNVGIGTTTPAQKLSVNGNIVASGTIIGSSDRNVKEHFSLVSARDVLEKVSALPISEWNYKADSNTLRHIGPMAQDFYAAFNVGMDDKHISMVDADGVALAAIQGLNQKLESEAKEKDTKILELNQRLEALEKLIRSQPAK
jgi:hypothetical protein